jgi:uncharacterized protein (DUF779 family)
MKVTATDRAARIVEQMRAMRSGRLTITIGTGCCESTAPFLYEDFWPGPDQEVVGHVGDVEVFAPAYLRKLYPGDEGAVVDVDEDYVAESLSIETELGCRFVLRGAGFEVSESPACATEPSAPPAVNVRELPEHLRGLRIR